jgi:solute carrier family 26 protein
VAFFSVIAYLILGTSKHLSMGTHGVIALMVGNAIKQYDGILYANSNSSQLINITTTTATTTSTFLSNDPNEAKIMIAMTLALLVGCMQLIFGLINAGFISLYLSDSLNEALTIGSSYLIVISEIEFLIGIQVKTRKLPFRLLDVSVA